MSGYNVQQKQFIQEYRQKHNLNSDVSDEQIIVFIQKEMKASGVVYQGFENLAEPKTSAKFQGQIFGNATASGDMKGLGIEKNAGVETTDNQNVTVDENGSEIITVKNGEETAQTTIRSKDESGNTLETVVSYTDGRPSKQIKKQNGNIVSTTTYKYHSENENNIEYVTLETVKSDRSKVSTNVLETDDYGNYSQEDFIDRTTTSMDGTETTMYVQDGKVFEQKSKIDGKKIITIYNGSELKDYDAGKLYKLAEQTQENGVINTAEYDGQGNTITTVQNGETPALIAQKFNVEENALKRLNPKKGKDAITQVGADVIIPGEFSSTSATMKNRKSKENALADFSQQEQQKLVNELYISEIQDTKLNKDYKNVYEFAKDSLLTKGIQNPSKEQINTEANKLILLNGNEASYKAGSTIKTAQNPPDEKTVRELSKYGFKPAYENQVFYSRFNKLNPSQKQNVLNVMKYCTSNNIKDTEKIKAEILNTFPDINLFDSGKTIPTAGGQIPAHQRMTDKPVSVETFISDTLKLDLKTGVGKTVYERLVSLPQEELNRISAKNINIEACKSFDEIADNIGVNIRTAAEIQMKNNSPKEIAKREKLEIREIAAENISLAYDNAINVIKSYQDNQGIVNVGFYREKLGQLLSKINPTDVATCFDDVVKRLEKERDFAVSYLKTNSTNENDFKKAFKELTGIDYNEKDVKSFIETAQNEGVDWSEAYDKAFGNKAVNYAVDKVNFQSYADGAGDIVLMLIGTEAFAKTVFAKGSANMAFKGLSRIVSPKLARIGTAAIAGGETLGAWTLASGTVNNLTKKSETTAQDWKNLGYATAGSVGFGGFGGLINSTVVAKVVNNTQKLVGTSLAAKGSEALAKGFEKSSAMSGSELMSTYFMTQTPGVIAKSAGFLTEVAGFTGYEIALDVTKDLLTKDGTFPEDMTAEKLADYLGEKFKGQVKMLGEIKGISSLMMMIKGGKAAQRLAVEAQLNNSESLKNTSIKKVQLNGRDIYEVKLPDGNRMLANSPLEAVAACNMVMQLDAAKNAGEEAPHVTTYAETVKNLKSSNSAKETADAEGNKIIIYHRNLLNAGDYTFAKFNPEGKLVEQGKVPASKLHETFGREAQEFSKINKSGMAMSSIDAGVVETICRTLKINYDHSKMQKAPVTEPSEILTKTVDAETAKSKLEKFIEKETEKRTDADYLLSCCMDKDGRINEVLFNEMVFLLEKGASSFDISYIIKSFNTNDRTLDYNKIAKYNELVEKGADIEQTSSLLNNCRDENGFYSENIYKKITSLKQQDYSRASVINACKIDGKVSEQVWQKALELEAMGFENENINQIIKACHINDYKERYSKPVGFSEEAYSKVSPMLKEHNFKPDHISSIIEKCMSEGKFSEQRYNNALYLKDKIKESYIYDFVEYPKTAMDDMLKFVKKYNIEDAEYDFRYIMSQCVSKEDGNVYYSPLTMAKAEELYSKYNVKLDKVSSLLSASKLDGEIDLKLYRQVVDMYQKGFTGIGSIIRACTENAKNPEENSKVDYALLNKAKEWKEIGVECSYIGYYSDTIKSSNIDISQRDYVKELKEADFSANLIAGTLEALNYNKEMPANDFINKMIKLQELTKDNETVDNTLRYLTGNKNEIKKENVDLVLEMADAGVKKPHAILYYVKDNRIISTDKLKTAVSYVKEGIAEGRVGSILKLKTPENEKALIDLAKVISKDYKNDYSMLYEVANNKNYSAAVIDAIKNGAKEEDVYSILTHDFQYASFRRNLPNEKANEVEQNVKIKLLDALKKNPDKLNEIKEIIRDASYEMSEDLSLLSLYLNHIDNYRQVRASLFPLDYNNRRVGSISPAAVRLFNICDKNNIPEAESTKLVDAFCKESFNRKLEVPDNVVTKIIELHKSGKLDSDILNAISEYPMADPKYIDVINEIIKLKKENKLSSEDLEHGYTLRQMLVNYAADNKVENRIFDNYKEILDFFINHRETFTVKNPDNHKILGTPDIIYAYASRHFESNKIDISALETLADLVSKTGASPVSLRDIISNYQGDELIKFAGKADLESYKDAVNFYVEKLCYIYTKNTCSEIFNDNLTSREINFILDAQKIAIDISKDGKPIFFLDNNFIKPLTEGNVSDKSLDKIRYHLELEADQYKAGKQQYFDIQKIVKLADLYIKNPEKIEKIEDIMFDKGFYENQEQYLINRLSSEPDVLNKQLELLDRLFVHAKPEYIKRDNLAGSDIKGTLSNKIEDLDAKLEIMNSIDAKFNKSAAQKTIDRLKKRYFDIHSATYLLNAVNSENLNVVKLVMDNPKYPDASLIAGNVSKENAELIENIIKTDAIKDVDVVIDLANHTHRDEYKTDFIKKNFDIFSKSRDIATAARAVNPLNENLIVRLYSDKTLNFPQEHIFNIANSTNYANINLITRLCTDKELGFKPEIIQKIAYKANHTNNELAEKLCTDKILNCPKDKIPEILETASLLISDIKSLSLSQKINTMSALSALPSEMLNLLRRYTDVDIDAIIAKLTVSLGKKKDIISIPEEQQKLFMQNVIANNNKDAENVIKTFDFAQYEKQGLPLKYSRNSFTSNIENIIKELSTEEQTEVLEHFGLVRGNAGFDGLSTNKPYTGEKASRQVIETAKRVQQEIEMFTAKNEVKTGDETVDRVMNGLIQGLPEFTSVVGKEQHGTHAYSVDIHTLKVLQSAMNNPLYETLPDVDKTILKIAALVHDFGKKGGVVDAGHASVSSEYAAAIMEKFNIPAGIKDRIIDIVENHHWFEAYNTGRASAQDVAVRCRRPQDFAIYEILAKADFENVNKDFHIARSEGVHNQAEFDKFMHDKMQAIDEALNLMYSKANLVFDTKFMKNGEFFPRETTVINGEKTELKVLDLNKLDNNENLQEYGFSTGVTKENARFIVHMTSPNEASMESVRILTANSLNQSAWSTSLVKASNNRTYSNRNFGFVFDVDLANISEAYYQNTGSGTSKNIETFKRILFTGNNEARTYVRDNLLKELSKNGIELNDAEYIQLAKYLASKKYTTQITKDIKIGNKVINHTDLVKGLEKSRDELFNGGDIHSEMVPLNPRIKGLIAKVEKLEDCPDEFLLFAKKHNLPIILMKNARKK